MRFALNFAALPMPPNSAGAAPPVCSAASRPARCPRLDHRHHPRHPGTAEPAPLSTTLVTHHPYTSAATITPPSVWGVAVESAMPDMPRGQSGNSAPRGNRAHQPDGAHHRRRSTGGAARRQP